MSQDDIVQIRVSRQTIGIIGLKVTMVDRIVFLKVGYYGNQSIGPGM